MAGRIISLSPARFIKEPPFIDTDIRADLGDYGPPGSHLHPPVALKGRARAAALGIPGATEADGDGADASCLESLSGQLIHFNPTVTTSATLTRLAVSRPIPSPFLISEIGYFSNTAFTVNQVFTIGVADDDDTADRTDTAAPPESLLWLYSTGGWIFPTNVWQHTPINYKVATPNKRIKLFVFNNTGGTIRLELHVTVLVLP